jgi:hypothetical protein
MKVSKEDFLACASQELITPEQAEALWEALSERQKNRPFFDFANVAYFFGVLIVLSAMTWFMTLAWEEFGGSGLFTIASLYIISFLLIGRRLWFQQNLRFPGGVLVTLAVCLTPLAIYGLQQGLGIWPNNTHLSHLTSYQEYFLWIKKSWFFLELGTVVAGLIAIRVVPFPFLTVPITLTLWYMAMDLAPFIWSRQQLTWEQQLLVALWFGLGCLVVAYWIDLYTKRRLAEYASWLYFLGLLSFWVPLTLMGGNSQFQTFLYFLINVGLIILSLLLKRRIFLLFGGIGVLGYLSHIAYQLFADSVLFPLTLTAFGVIVIVFGIFSQRRPPQFNFPFLTWLTNWLRKKPPNLQNIQDEEAGEQGR